MDQKTVTQLIAAMNAVLQQETNLIASYEEDNQISSMLQQQRRTQAMHDGFASVLQELATDTGAARVAISMLVEYPR